MMDMVNLTENAINILKCRKQKYDDKLQQRKIEFEAMKEDIDEMTNYFVNIYNILGNNNKVDIVYNLVKRMMNHLYDEKPLHNVTKDLTSPAL
ncbi:hypothetical protein C1645_835551 [Glomus cerebriforme]|uniref:Uncharacterized protein n=1 Tax=Glomus cerebriforme TaxID=658196 RepID=A0A397SBT8_9GLOM|nr:hypothetical protein C1645_835551 [Glomus cerebriforme]